MGRERKCTKALRGNIELFVREKRKGKPKMEEESIGCEEREREIAMYGR